MAEYRVKWEIDIDATSPRAAAEQALDIQRDGYSMATHFVVMDGDKPHGIDLGDRFNWPASRLREGTKLPSALEILGEVIMAMQPAEEIGGPEGSDYVLLMAAIAAEANKRIRNFHENSKG